MQRTPGWSLTFALFTLLAAPAEPSFAQGEPYVIQGTVVDVTTGDPLGNVTVQIRGTQLGALTDTAGAYRIAASIDPGEYTLVYTFTGRRTATRAIDLGADRTINVGELALEETTIEMEEIAVTVAGQETERAKTPISVATIAGEEINEAPAATSVDQALVGKVAGAVISENSGQPGGGISIRLRGSSSILGDNEPLIVIDGVIVDNNDEALIGLGSNAGRQGGGGALTNRLSDIPAADIERIEVLKGAAAAALYGSRANNGVIQIFTKKGRAGAPRISFSTSVYASETPDRYDLLLVPLAGRGDVVIGTADSVGDPVERFDLQDDVFRTGVSTNNHLSVSGGSERTTYYLSGAWTREEGILETTDYERANARGSVTSQVLDNLQLVANAEYLDSEANFIPEGEQTQGVLTSIIFTPPSFDPRFDPDLGRFPYNPILGANVFDILENWEASQDISRFIGNVEARWRPIEPLELRYLFGIDDYRLQDTYLQPLFSLSASFTGSIQTPSRFSRQFTNEVTGTHDWAYDDGLEFNTLAGFRYTSDRGEEVRAGATDLPPGQTTVGGATQFASQGISLLRRVEAFAQEQVTFGDRLTVTGGLNFEGASAFGPDERWQIYPKLGIAYLVSREPWWQGSAIGNTVSTLKLRAAYGETGGQPPGPFLRFDNFFPQNFAGRPGQVASVVAGNAGLKPEREREIEVGFEAGLLRDRLSFDFTYYDDKTDDLILPVPLPPSRGLQSQFQNVGTVSNKGVELGFNSVNIDRSDFRWSSRVTFAANDSEVEDLVTDTDTLQFGYLNYVIEGQPVGVFYGWHYERKPDGSIATNEAGIPLRAIVDGVAQQKILGDPNPDWTASLGNTFTFGPVTAEFLLDGRFGNDVANFSRRISEFFGADAKIAEEISGEKPIGFYARNVQRLLTYEEFVEDGSFVKLREASLGYRFDQAFVQSFGASSLDVRLIGRNLYTWTDYSGLDPEVNLFASNTVAKGVDFAITPIPRSLGVNLTFNF